MGKWLRRIRGAISTAVTWAVAWSAVGMVPRLVLGFNADVPFPLVFGLLGCAAGFTLAALVVLSTGRMRWQACYHR